MISFLRIKLHCEPPSISGDLSMASSPAHCDDEAKHFGLLADAR